MEGKLGRSLFKIGIRKPSLTKAIAARTSPLRLLRHTLGIKVPRGWGWLTDPKKAVYNRVYSRLTIGLFDVIKALVKR